MGSIDDYSGIAYVHNVCASDTCGAVATDLIILDIRIDMAAEHSLSCPLNLFLFRVSELWMEQINI